MTSTFSSDELLLIGRITSSFGIKGQIKLSSITSHPEHLRTVKTVLIGPAYTPYRLLQVAEHKQNLLVLRLEGVDTRDASEALRSADVYIRAVDAAPLEAEEYFFHDLPGLSVRTLTGEVIGTVTEVLETGANDVLVVQRPDASEALIPMIRSVVKDVNLPEGLISIDPLPGLLD